MWEGQSILSDEKYHGSKIPSTWSFEGGCQFQLDSPLWVDDDRWDIKDSSNKTSCKAKKYLLSKESRETAFGIQRCISR